MKKLLLWGICFGSFATVMNAGNIDIYLTESDDGYRLDHVGTAVFEESVQPSENQAFVLVDPSHQFQEILGIGGAITDAAAEVFSKLPESGKAELLKAYYDPEAGIGYTLARTTIHSSDFSSESYAYVEEGDGELKTFSIEHDRQFRIPLIKEAMAAAGGELTLYASPWSPPGFMKSNGQMLQGGKLLPEYRQAWANYFVKFIKAYEAEGIPVWGLTIQNEPMAKQRWESCIYTAEEERDFLKNYLGPTLEKAGLGDKKIIVWDHNRDLIVHRAQTIFSDPEASKYAWGIGFHWYENGKAGRYLYENLQRVAEAYPDKHLVFTEGCVEAFDRENLNRWSNAERYGQSMINDFNNNAVAWTDWNILLDETGGPNHVNNLCFAPVHADTQTGELLFTPSYYYIGHFSKFVKPGDKRISTSSNRGDILATSFLRENGEIATIVMNYGDNPYRYVLIRGDESATIDLPLHSIQTLVYQSSW